MPLFEAARRLAQMMPIDVCVSDGAFAVYVPPPSSSWTTIFLLVATNSGQCLPIALNVDAEWQASVQLASRPNGCFLGSGPRMLELGFVYHGRPSKINHLCIHPFPNSSVAALTRGGTKVHAWSFYAPHMRGLGRTIPEALPCRREQELCRL